MHLVFLYVKQYQVLRNIEFNFDLNCRFRYCEGKLELIKRDRSLPENFFTAAHDQNSIECVSAIVGKNGTGKTSLSKLLKELISEQAGTGCIAVFSNAKNELFHIYCNLETCDNKNLLIKNLKTSEYKLYRGFERLSTCLSIIYYSSNFTSEFGFDGDPVTPRGEGWIQVDSMNSYAAIDASITACIRGALNEAASRNPYVSILMCERRRVLTFLQDIASDGDLESALDLPFNLSKNAAYVHFDKEVLDSVLKVCRNKPWQSFEGDPMPTYIDEDDEPIVWKRLILEAHTVLCQNSFFEVLLCFIGIRLSSPFSYIAARADNMTTVAQSLLKILKRISCARNLEDAKEEDIIEYLHQLRAGDWGDESLAELDDLAEFLNAVSKYRRAFCDLNVPLPLSDRDDVKINAYLGLMESYLKIRGNRDFMKFGFTLPFSSGEMSYISMWARLYDAIRSASVGQPAAKKNLLVVVDEAETAFHPEWQRELVKRMILFFGVIAKNFQVHLLFNTHSPIILSDVPSGNAVFLRKRKDGTAFADQSLDRRIFAANIFDLFRESFFLENGTVGAFAQEKIDKALKDIASVVKKSCRTHKTAKIKKELSQVLKLIGDENLLKYLADLRDAKLI